MVVAERARTGAHRWENDWCPKCKLRMTFWFVSETRTRCAMCATEKDKTRGLDLGPREEEAPAPVAESPSAEAPSAEAPSPEAPSAEAPPAEAAAPAPEPEAAFVPVPVPAPPPPEEKPPQEPVWILSWCSECRYNASFVHERRETFKCMSCGTFKVLPGVAPPQRD